MRTTTCDRCGTTCPENKVAPGLGQPYTTIKVCRGLSTRTRDLCGLCRESFDVFMEGAPEAASVPDDDGGRL